MAAEEKAAAAEGGAKGGEAAGAGARHRNSRDLQMLFNTPGAAELPGNHGCSHFELDLQHWESPGRTPNMAAILIGH